jgi:Mn2+/Fe2+ NRAMP family transporter
MSRKDTQKHMQAFLVRRTRQFIAIVATVILVLLVAMLYKRSDLFGEFSKNTLAFAQILVILAFINFTAFNWRCPACKKYMGNDMNPRGCKKCGARLQ